MDNKKVITDSCDFRGVTPIMMDLPYPAIQVEERNPAYANLLSIDYCGAVSEMTAISQYINNENKMSCEKCPLAKTILGIAMAEMIHLQKLGQLIVLLGGNIDFSAKFQNGRQKMWTPEYASIPNHVERMILSDIDAEKDAINQYRMHMKVVKDSCVNAVLSRIVKDEEYHIMILEALLREC